MRPLILVDGEIVEGEPVLTIPTIPNPSILAAVDGQPVWVDFPDTSFATSLYLS